jgi:adenylate kinase
MINSTKTYKNIVLFGAPGSGKGTQATKIISQYGLTDVTPGNLLRQIVSEKSHKFYEQIKNSMQNGTLVDISIIESIVSEKFLSSIKLPDFKGFLFDGFPRSLEQSNFLDSLLKQANTQISFAILLDVDVKVLVDRIVNRFTCSSCGAVYNKKSNPTKTDGVCDFCGSNNFSHRNDDNEETVKNRVKVFNESCRDVVELYKSRNLLKIVNASNPIETVENEIKSLLD